MKQSAATCSWHKHDTSVLDPTDAAVSGHSTKTFNANHNINPIFSPESEKPLTFASYPMGAPAPVMQSISKSAIPCFSASERIDIDFMYQVTWQYDDLLPRFFNVPEANSGIAFSSCTNTDSTYHTAAGRVFCTAP